MYIYKILELNNLIKKTLEENNELKYICVEGEASNITYQSRHMYLTLKDKEANIKCAGFNYIYNEIPKDIKEGDKIKVYGKVNVYNINATTQIICSKIEKSNDLGDLYKKREELLKLYKEKGYFEKNIKKPLPKNPKIIGVVTAHTGAAIHDIINTTHKRNPGVDIFVYSCKVQGFKSELEIARGIEYFNNCNLDIDCLIVGRGGGSIEDLWAFNEAVVIEAIYNSKIPVISAVGHETDILLSDFVADVRAATPTQACEILIPVKKDLIEKLENISFEIKNQINFKLKNSKDKLMSLKKSYAIKNFYSIQVLDRINKLEQTKKLLKKELVLKLSTKYKREKLNKLKMISKNCIDKKIYKSNMDLKNISSKLEKYNTEELFNRGYTVTLKNGMIIKNKKINKGDNLETIYYNKNKKIKIESVVK